MLRTTNLTGSLTILQSLINVANKDEIGGDKSGGNKTNLSDPLASKRFTRADY